jgi:hypothetical protein
MNTLHPRKVSAGRLQITLFAGIVVLGTTVIILPARWISRSWAAGVTGGGIAGIVPVATYRVIFRPR